MSGEKYSEIYNEGTVGPSDAALMSDERLESPPRDNRRLLRGTSSRGAPDEGFCFPGMVEDD